MTNNLPKYVKQDLDILYRYEFSKDKFDRTINNDHKISKKLFSIAKKYPQKYLADILEYFGYFYGEEDLKEEDYRDEVLHLAEYHFKKAMDDTDLMYEDINRQMPCLELGLITAWYDCRKTWYKYNKNTWKEWKYPQKSIYK